MLLIVATLFACPASAASVTDAPFVGPYPDNKEHTYFISSKLSTTQADAATWSMNYLDTATDMYDTKMTTKTSNTDVVFWAGTYAGDYAKTYAWKVCVALVSEKSDKCQQATVTINNYLPHSNYKSVLCHEVGHTLGFGHAGGANKDTTTANKTCLRDTPDVTKYATADISKINKRF